MWRGFRRSGWLSKSGVDADVHVHGDGVKDDFVPIMSCLMQTFARWCSRPSNACFIGNLAVRFEELETRVNMKRPAVNDTAKQKLPVRRIAEKTAIGSAIAGGTAASIIRFVAAGSSATGAISAAGVAVGAVTGGVVGSGIGRSLAA